MVIGELMFFVNVCGAAQVSPEVSQPRGGRPPQVSSGAGPMVRCVTRIVAHRRFVSRSRLTLGFDHFPGNPKGRNLLEVVVKYKDWSDDLYL